MYILYTEYMYIRTYVYVYVYDHLPEGQLLGLGLLEKRTSAKKHQRSKEARGLFMCVMRLMSFAMPGLRESARLSRITQFPDIPSGTSIAAVDRTPSKVSGFRPPPPSVTGRAS